MAEKACAFKVAVTVPTHKDVAVKVSLRGSSKADPLVAEHAATCTAYLMPFSHCLHTTSTYF